MHRNYFLVIVALAIGCLFLIFISLHREIEAPITKEQVIESPKAPYKSYINGVGIVESCGGNIYIGTPLNRIVNKIFVSVGAKIKKGEPLFRLENRDLIAELKVLEAAYQTDIAKLHRLESLPRPEDLAEAEATLKISSEQADLAKSQYERVLELPDPRAISREESSRRLSNYEQAKAKLRETEAQFAKIKAGTWEPDLEIARLEIQQAKANLDRIKAEIGQTIIRSPIDGTVLQVNAHEGESLPLDSNLPPMIIGVTNELCLRVSINQLDIPSFNSSTPAIAFLQGNSERKYELEFVKIEPFLVNKRSFTHEVTELVDTRVLHVIYRLKNITPDIYVGEQMDVFIETQYPHENKKI